MDKIKELFLKNKKIVIGLLVVVLLAWLYQKHGWKLKRLIKPSVKNNSPVAMDDNRKDFIESIGEKIYDDIEETAFWTGHDYTPYEKALDLYDNEISYMADFYESHLSEGETLYEAIDSQVYTWGDSPTRLMRKLKELNKN